MGDGVRIGFIGNFHQPFGDQGPRYRRAQQVLTLIEGITAKHGIDEVLHKLFSQVVHKSRNRT